jgi:predicted MFS family arabinose efflux permease
LRSSAGRPPFANRVLAIMALVTFATSLFMRAVDPVIPKIADEFAMDAGTVALLSTAFALPYAVAQPLLGAMADILGKTKLMTLCLTVLVMAALVGALATSFSALLASRVVSGIATGGIFPISLAIAADLVPVNERQVAISRLLAAAMLGNLLGSPGAGVIADLIGWRGIFALVVGLSSAALVAAIFGFRDVTSAERTRLDLAALAAGYRTIFTNPLAKFCYGAVLLEGIFLFGLFPFIATLLHAGGETRAAIAGLVIGGFALGGVGYTIMVSRLLASLGERRLMAAGGCVMALALVTVALRLPWPAQIIDFVVLGFGFYMLHGVIQIYATELAPAARGSAMALHSAFFFVGHALGPIVYRFGLAQVGLTASLMVSGGVVMAVGFACARHLQHPRAAADLTSITASSGSTRGTR